MRHAGIDVGSRSVKLVLVEDGAVRLVRIRENSFDPLAVCREILTDVAYDSVTATGYGRHLFHGEYDCAVISEIKAFGIGGRALVPRCRTILDIGGQDTKAAALDVAGRVEKFEMNDRCAAGTGRFLEIMAMALGYSLKAFGEAALTSEDSVRLSSMCTVFAESEVISLVARGARRRAVARGIHEAVARRCVAMLMRVRIRDEVLFVGGVARNPCMRALIRKAIRTEVQVPDEPQIVGALGCALQSEGSAAVRTHP